MAALNLGAAGSAPAIELPDLVIHWWGWPLGALPFALALLLAWRIGGAIPRGTRLVPWDRRRGPPAGIPPLTAWSPPAKLLTFLYVMAAGLTHLFAVGAIWQATRVAVSGNAEYFRYMKPLQLFRMSHQHAFGHGTMYLATGALALASSGGPRLKVLGIALAFLGAGSDLASWWLQKFGGPSFEPLSLGGGASFAAGFALLAALILRDLVPRAR